MVFETQGYDFGACPRSKENYLNVTCGSLTVQCGTKYDRELVTPPLKITFPDADMVNIFISNQCRNLITNHVEDYHYYRMYKKSATPVI